MHAIYIKNYLNLPKKEKEKFLTYIQIEKALPLIEQKVLFAESSLLLTFKEDRDIRELKNLFDAHFTRSNTPLTTYIVNNIIAKDDNLIIEFSHRKLRIKS
ncbi:MAG: hypothetical protein ACP5D3_08040 [Sulfurovum sp.]